MADEKWGKTVAPIRIDEDELHQDSRSVTRWNRSSPAGEHAGPPDREEDDERPETD